MTDEFMRATRTIDAPPETVFEVLADPTTHQAIDGTGPWCFESWQPRTEIVLKRHDAYKWGPSMYQNKGPVKFEKLSIKIVPEDASRVAAMLGGQFDVTHQIPLQFISQVKASPNLNVQEATPNFQLMYYGYKITRPMVSDKRVREAMNIAINRADIVTPRNLHPGAQPRTGADAASVEAASWLGNRSAPVQPIRQAASHIRLSRKKSVAVSSHL